MGFVFEKDTWPKWAKWDIWAPEIHQINGTFYVYFSARKRTVGKYFKSNKNIQTLLSSIFHITILF